MNSLKDQNYSSRFANGKKIREIRHLLGLTQLELAMRLDCSERLVRKMEKQGSVSVKSLSILCAFLNSHDIKVDLCDLVFEPNNALEVAKQWFTDQLIDGIEHADRKWFSERITLSNTTISKLKILEDCGVISVATAIHHQQHVAINFDIETKDSLSPDSSGSIWIIVEKNQITRLQVILDTRF